MRSWPKAILLLLGCLALSGCESNRERAIGNFLEESCRRDLLVRGATPASSKNCPAHAGYEIIRLKG